MNSTRAFEILGIQGHPTPAEIEQSFRALASEAHPDKGGSDQQMSELNEAKAVALGFINGANALVPVQIFQNALIVAQSHAAERHQRAQRLTESKKEVKTLATNKLRSYRRISTILAAICAGAMFLGKEVPAELFHKNVPASVLQNLDMLEREQLEARVAEENAKLSQMWLLFTLGFVVYAGIGAWFFTMKIDRVEHDLKQFEEDTSTKTLMHKHLRDLLQAKVSSSWTMEDLACAIEARLTTPEKFRGLVRTIGPMRLAQYLTERAVDIDLIESKETLADGELVEQYSVKPPSIKPG